MKKFFTGVKNWFIRHKPSKRRLIQLYAALLYNANIKGFVTGDIYKGNTKYACVPGFNCYSCPGAVGACPLGALQNALANSDTRAPFYVFGIIILFGLLLGRTICGFLCPMGLIQDLLYKIKSPKLKKNRITRILSYFKYVLLVAMVIIIPISYSGVSFLLPAFCKYICPVGTLEGSVSLLSNANNAGLFEMLGPLFTWKFCILVLIIVGSIFIYRLFCRFLCPLGAIYSFFCKLAMIGVKLDKQKCVDCGLCIQTCKMDIKHVGDHECIHCGECLKVCPTHAISWKGSKIFLHANAIEPAGESATGETVALADILNGGSVNGTVTVANANALQAEIAAENAQNQADEKSIAKMEKQREKAQKTAEKKAKRGTPAYVKKRNRILEAAAWVAALAVLATALVYYNFIYDPVEAASVYSVGEEFRDFTLNKFFSDGEDDSTYTLSDDLNDGKIVILNFWYIDCGSCEAEIPHFLELAADEEYSDKVSLVIIHRGGTIDNAETMINYDGTQMPYLEYYVKYRKGWIDSYSAATWCMDTDDEESIFLAAGGSSGYPVTAIIDGDGILQFRRDGNLSKEELYSEVDTILSSQK